jgi:hypothetical protein
MPLTLAFFGAAGIIAVALLARREAQVAAATRHSILNPALDVLDAPKLSIQACGFPKVEGRSKGRPFHVSLIPDTLTFRRLPQLWLDVTLKRELPSLRGSIAVLVRPSGADYYSLTERLDDRMEQPVGFPEACLIKGQGPGAQQILKRIAPYAAGLLADPKIKELAITPHGVRIVRQLSQGNRGSHLILRQSVFEGATLEPAELKSLMHAVTKIENMLVQPYLVSAA